MLPLEMILWRRKHQNHPFGAQSPSMVSARTFYGGPAAVEWDAHTSYVWMCACRRARRVPAGLRKGAGASGLLYRMHGDIG